jgi:hypothetical protein
MDAMQSMVDYWKIRCSNLTAQLKNAGGWKSEALELRGKVYELEAQNARLKEALAGIITVVELPKIKVKK